MAEIVASLSATGDPAAVIDTTATRISNVFGLQESEASEILQAARSDATTLAGSLR